ncbi:MAG: hypothetical protein AB7S80_19150, partial [Rhizobiaceae bacterium]
VRRRLPRLLVTGFNAFPGAPVNPTQHLVASLLERAGELAPLAEFNAAVLDVDYRALPARLVELGKRFRPDIALHFGLAGTATGFRLERLAWNRSSLTHPDNSGYLPEWERFCEGAESLESALPLAAIHARLTEAGLPVEYSDSAGEYLCNYLFYWSRAGLAKGFRPAMTGFIHVPPLGDRAGEMPLDRLVEGALLIVDACVAVWKTQPAKAKGPASLPGPSES